MTSDSLRFGFALTFLAAAAAACSSSTSGMPGGSSGSSGGVITAADKAAVVKSYGAVVHANYEEALTQMKALQTAVNALVATPTQATHDAAKAAWIAARPSYLLSEGYRFYGGPIDEAEGLINSWPIDENFVDYVVGDDEAGIINKKGGTAFLFPTIDKAILTAENQKGGEKNMSAGWHVIEFLLWGQDLNKDGTPHAEGPGMRPYTDFVDGGTAKNADRRRTCLKAATDLMVESFETVEVQWDDSPDTYRGKMAAGDPDAALSSILKGIGALAATELPKERMNNAYETKDQEEEHSCFSDTTNQDLANNAQAIENVYLGRYGTVTGPSIADLVKTKDAALDAKTRADIAALVAATKAIPAPFDNAILGADDSDGRKKIKASIDSCAVVKNDIQAIAGVLGVQINLSQ